MTITPRKAPFKYTLRPLALSGLAAIGLSACAGSGANYQPIIDGPLSANYAADLGDCRAVAKQREYVNADTKNDALLGGLVGGLLGLTETGNDTENFIAGALVGGVIGGAGTAYDAHGERKDIVRNCMAGRGYNVVG